MPVPVLSCHTYTLLNGVTSGGYLRKYCRRAEIFTGKWLYLHHYC